MTDAAVARANMVESQLRPSRIDDPGVLAAMGAVPRERFVPASCATAPTATRTWPGRRPLS